MKPQIILQEFSAKGIHNGDLGKTRARLDKSKAWKRQRIVVLIPAVLGPRPSALAPRASPLEFADVTTKSKITFVHSSGASPEKRMVETFGSGVAWIDYDDDEQMINGYVCEAALRALLLVCPSCGMLHDVRATDRQSRVFDRERQRFRCSRCRFTASVYVIVDVGVRAEEERPAAAR